MSFGPLYELVGDTACLLVVVVDVVFVNVGVVVGAVIMMMSMCC